MRHITNKVQPEMTALCYFRNIYFSVTRKNTSTPVGALTGFSPIRGIILTFFLFRAG